MCTIGRGRSEEHSPVLSHQHVVQAQASCNRADQGCSCMWAAPSPASGASGTQRDPRETCQDWTCTGGPFILTAEFPGNTVGAYHPHHVKNKQEGGWGYGPHCSALGNGWVREVGLFKFSRLMVERQLNSRLSLDYPFIWLFSRVEHAGSHTSVTF